MIENSDHLLTLNLPIFMIGYSLKLECEKLAGEKMEIQRHYVMVKKKIPKLVSVLMHEILWQIIGLLKA